jgi:hypothetical protein
VLTREQQLLNGKKKSRLDCVNLAGSSKINLN